MGSIIVKRQDTSNNDGDYYDDDNYYWGYSNTAVAIKWAIIAAIFVIFLLWFVGGYMHAQRRMKRGQPPLRYHRFLVPRRQRRMFAPQPQFGGYYPQTNGYGDGYPMQTYPQPPPAYHAEHVPPPVYEPPEGGSKVAPAQEYAVPPPDAPPGHANAGESSSVTHDVPLNYGGANQQGLAANAEEPAVRPTKKSGLMSRINPWK
ncbi:hypothetical protein MMC21_000530 [Puttea exsequens]|nr:hypothetical protein [Puttea exsequens]